MSNNIDKIKERKNKEAIALRTNLKKRKIFQKKNKKKNKKKINNVNSTRLLDKKNVQRS